MKVEEDLVMHGSCRGRLVSETAMSAHGWAVVSWERMLPYRGNRLITKVGNKRRQFDRRSGHAKNLLPKQVLRPKQIQQPKRAQQPAKELVNAPSRQPPPLPLHPTDSQFEVLVQEYLVGLCSKAALGGFGNSHAPERAAYLL